MQPFLSGETTLALLLTVLTLLFFAAAGDEHPYDEPYHHKTLPVEAGRSSAAMELASVSEQPQIIKGQQELVVRLVEGLQEKHEDHHQRVMTGKEEEQQQQQQQQRKLAEVMVVGRPRGSSISLRQANKPRLSTFITSRLRPRRNLQILAALLSHRSLFHTASPPSTTPLLSAVLKSRADTSWSLEALLGLGLPLAAAKKSTTTIPGRSSLRCRGKKVKFVDGGHEQEIGGQRQLESRGGEKKTDELSAAASGFEKKRW